MQHLRWPGSCRSRRDGIFLAEFLPRSDKPERGSLCRTAPHGGRAGNPNRARCRAGWLGSSEAIGANDEKDAPSEGLSADATVTERYVEALDLGPGELRNAGTREALTTKLVKAMHATLMKGAPEFVRPGEYRDTQAWIGNGRIEDATFVPAPPKRIAEGMEELAAPCCVTNLETTSSGRSPSCGQRTERCDEFGGC